MSNPKTILIDGEFFLRVRDDKINPNPPKENPPGLELNMEDVYIKIRPDGTIDREYMYGTPMTGLTQTGTNHLIAGPWHDAVDFDDKTVDGDEITLPTEPVVWPIVFDYVYVNPKPEQNFGKNC